MIYQEFLALPSDVNGSLPTEIGFLSRLHTLQFADMGYLVGGIPSEFHRLSRLTHLSVTSSLYDDISFTSFLTSLPKSLVELELESGGFYGSIPQSISSFQNLTSLRLAALPTLTGSIPSEIGLMTKLQRLEFENLSLSSVIPSEIGQLTHLTYLSVQGSLATTKIPSEITQLTGLLIIPP
jgi:Leucine-rich repeat (LRR) protein